MKKYKLAYNSQKCAAGKRGIDWQFTYETWLAWWGDDIVNRGRCLGQLCMARYNDTGPYHPDNVKKITHADNVREALAGVPLSAAVKAKISSSRNGHVVSTETRQKLRMANIGKKAAAATKAKMSNSRLAYLKDGQCVKINKQMIKEYDKCKSF